MHLNFLDEKLSIDNFNWDIFFLNYSTFFAYDSIINSNLYKDQYQPNGTRHLEYIFSVGDLNFLGILDFYKYILTYQFRDEDNSTIQTNKVGNKAFAVLKAASSILLSGIEKMGLDNIFCIEMHISKNESRRLFLYRKMIERYDSFGKVFKNEFIDTTTDNNYITYYRWK
jgi:hypothetical protein